LNLHEKVFISLVQLFLIRLICCGHQNYQSKKIEHVFAEAKSSAKRVGTIKFVFDWLVFLLEKNMPNLY